MILYIEKWAQEYPLTQEICACFPHADTIIIDHYKNLFDKSIPYKNEKSFLLAVQTGSVLLPVPESYWYGSHSFFLRTHLNCLFDCEYCYLKWAFKNDIPVFFVNIEDMQERVSNQIWELREWWYADRIQIYPSNWTDLLASEKMSWFHRHRLWFFEQFPWVYVESRTKSTAISSLLELVGSWVLLSVPQQTEIAYSLNPQLVIDEYERWTPSLEKRISAIKQLLATWWQVGLRLMPLLPVEDFEKVYEDFFQYLLDELPIDELSSIFFGGFLLTKADFKRMRKKDPDSDLRKFLDKEESWLLRVDVDKREKMYNLILSYFPQAKVSFDEM